MTTATRRTPMIGNAGLTLIQHFEGCARRQADGTLAAYPDPGTGGAPWTIGWGSTGPDIAPGVIWTPAQCDARFRNDITAFAARVAAAIGIATTGQHQFDAFVAFAYNVGVLNLHTSTLLKKHIAGDYAGARAEFAKWDKADGHVLPGLATRRAAEAALYATPDTLPAPTY